MIAADLRYRTGDECAADVLYGLITELTGDSAGSEDVYDTICSLIQLANDARQFRERDQMIRVVSQ